MNKKLELTKMSNRELIESAFKSMADLGFHVIDIEFNDTYFFFEGDKDNICEFHIKEIPRFKFAFWRITRLDDLKKQLEEGSILWTDTYKVRSMTELLFFTQYERDLDKFKPSRSGFLTGIYRETWIEGVDNESDETHQVEKWYMHELEGILNFMKKHPIKSYVYVGSQIQDIYDEVNGIICLWDFVKDWYYDKKWKFIYWYKLQIEIKASINLAKKIGNNYNVLVILRPEGWSPRIDIIVRRKENYDYISCIKQETLFTSFDDKWCTRISLDQYDLELTTKSMTDEDKEADEKLKMSFIKRLTYHYADLDCDYDVLYCNCEELIDIKTIK